VYRNTPHLTGGTSVTYAVVTILTVCWVDVIVDRPLVIRTSDVCVCVDSLVTVVSVGRVDVLSVVVVVALVVVWGVVEDDVGEVVDDVIGDVVDEVKGDVVEDVVVVVVVVEDEGGVVVEMLDGGVGTDVKLVVELVGGIVVDDLGGVVDELGTTSVFEVVSTSEPREVEPDDVPETLDISVVGCEVVPTAVLYMVQ
jgi:hypothetical protein